ncbi:MAG: hypothetical protein K9J06_15925 [Flavobacteriales bacterium]|nr:hypothetical protein [Flavobacteriales bacterium]
MKNYIPTTTHEQLAAFSQLMLRQMPPSLHRPQMWEELRQAFYEARQLLRRYSKAHRVIMAHRRFRAKVRAAQVVEG